MKHISILLPLLLALVCLSAYGAESGNEYRKYDVRSGLSNNSVKSILQDRNGYVWLATKDGLNKFNSKDFEAFCSSASGHMVRNLYSQNSLPSRPTRRCRKIAPSPGLSSTMARLISSAIGASRISASRENTMSCARRSTQ